MAQGLPGGTERPTPAARRRRALLVRRRRALAIDLAAAALVAALTLSLAAGLGVVAVIALPVLVLGSIWIGLERLARQNPHPPLGKGSRDRARPV
jgi:hypothetical protein